MTSGHVRPEPWPPMWRVVERVVLGPPEEGAAPASATLLTPAAPHHQAHHHHHHHHHQPQQQPQQQQQPPPGPPQQLGPPLHHWAHQHYLPPPLPPALQPLTPAAGPSAAPAAPSASQPSSGQEAPAPSQQQQQQQHHHHHQSRPSVKRPMSDSDCDDVFSEESGKEPCNSPGGDSCQHTSRKRRRGMIEKKRRDRINASLGELRRLVPAAARDPHSGKLEKAEILQLTVEHLRTLKSKGVEGYDSSKLAMDYHAVGWGECAAEVGRYLVTMEGLDERDPLRLRLLSHLQSFQRAGEQAAPQSPPGPPAQQQQQPSAYGPEQAANPALAPWPPAAQYAAQYPAQYGQQQHGKPYRPWGAELAY